MSFKEKHPYINFKEFKESGWVFIQFIYTVTILIPILLIKRLFSRKRGEGL